VLPEMPDKPTTPHPKAGLIGLSKSVAKNCRQKHHLQRGGGRVLSKPI